MHLRVDEQIAEHADRAGAAAELAGGAEADNGAAHDSYDHAAMRKQVSHVGGVGSGPLLVLPGRARDGRDLQQVIRDRLAHLDSRHGGNSTSAEQHWARMASQPGPRFRGVPREWWGS